MTETKRGRPRKVETEIQEVDSKIQEMQAELGNLDGHGRPLTWDEVTSTTPDELVAKEQRRGVLPRLLHAARVRRQELEVGRCERAADEVRERLEPSYEAFQAKEAELLRVKEERDAARGEWAVTLSAVSSADERTKRAQRELDALQQEGGGR